MYYENHVTLEQSESYHTASFAASGLGRSNTFPIAALGKNTMNRWYTATISG